VRWAAFLGIAAIWTCVPGAAWLFGRELGWGVVGAWLGFIGETGVGAALLWWRWTRGHWRARALAPRADSTAW
jgi:Na+-driven multidrug efflux pump